MTDCDISTSSMVLSITGRAELAGFALESVVLRYVPRSILHGRW